MTERQLPDPAQLAEAIEGAVPELRPVGPLRSIGAGFYSFAFETRSGALFRVARQPEASERHDVEMRVLPLLAPLLQVEIPVPRWRLPPSSSMPYGAIGYRRIEGTSPTQELLTERGSSGLAEDIGRFLAALHNLEQSQFELLLPATGDPRPGFLDLREAVAPSLRERLEPGELRRVESWWEDVLADDTLRAFEPVLCHGDPWYGNLLVEEATARLVGVVDWEHAHIGDPAFDLATQLHLGPEFTRAVLIGYKAGGRRTGEALRARIQRYSELREFYGVRYAATYTDEKEMNDSIAKLRRGPILAPGQPL